MHKLGQRRSRFILYSLRKVFCSNLGTGVPRLTRTAPNDEESSVGKWSRAFRIAEQESRHDSPIQGPPFHKVQPIGSAGRDGAIQNRMRSQIATRHSPGTTAGPESLTIPKHYNAERNTNPRELVKRMVGREGGTELMPRAAGTTSEAIDVLKNRQKQGIVTDSYTFVELLKRCSRQDDPTAAREVHECIIDCGMDRNPYVANTLLTVYMRYGRLEDARQVFDVLGKKTVVTYRIMISGLAKNNRAEDAVGVFNRMIQAGEHPDGGICWSILKACASPTALKWGKEVHNYVRQSGLESDERVGTALVQMYARCGCITEARQVFDRLPSRNVITWNVMLGAYATVGRVNDTREVFDRMERRDVISWNIMIGAYAGKGCGEEACRLFLQMKRDGFVPDAITYLSILNPSANTGDLEWVKEVHSHALETGAESDVRVGNALINIYAKGGSLVDARSVFDRMEKRDLITWNTLIGAYADKGFGGEAYRLFVQMEREGFNPDSITYVCFLNGSASAGALEWVKQVHSHALKSGLASHLLVGNALIHMYAKSGSIDDARRVFERMEKRDVITWTAMIGGLAEHGCGHEALDLFRKMSSDSVKPDGTLFVAVLSACCHAGLLDDGRRLFSSMRRIYGIQPTVVHCNCMVDLLGRAGRLEEAKLFIGGMPVQPNGVTWAALLGACRTYGNVELGEVASKELLKLEPKSDGAFVLLSNIYAAAGQWEKVTRVRAMMQERGIRKERGHSWIEVGKKVHKFAVGDTTHPETKEIYAELSKLTEKVKAEGYIPDTDLVLQNIDEEDKELALCSHSERLAIAYGLMRTPSGKPIRVYKNLRVCADCHTATKFISKVTGREIIARDSARFHHFKDGVCSCGDYW